MKTIALTLATATAAFAAVNDVVPQAFNNERYEETRTASPFVLATKVVEDKPIDEPKPFANLYVVGLGRAEGKEYVTIVRVGEEATPIRLWGNTPDDEGLSVQQIIWSDAFGKSKVKLKKGSDIGEIGFNENAIKSAVAGTPVPQGVPPTGRPPLPGQPTPPGFNRPPNSPTQPTINPNIPRPPTTGATNIPRPPTSFTPPPAAGTNGANNNTTQGRQRIRVINNGNAK